MHSPRVSPMWFAALTVVGWPALTSAAVSIQSVTFAGTASNPTITISGSGFNPAPTPLVSGYPGFTGFDYGNELVFTDSSANPSTWEAGRSTPGNTDDRDYIGIVILTYSDTQITFQFGSSYAQFYYFQNIYRLNGGDSFSMKVHGAVFSGVVSLIESPTGIQIVSGNGQATTINTVFPAPLVVQVDGSSRPVPGYSVQFAAGGSVPITLSASSAVTDSNGRAQITVQAGGTKGTATATASIPGFTQTFTLTINPPAPAITSVENAAGGGRTIAPNTWVEIDGSNLAPAGDSRNWQTSDLVNNQMPTRLDGVSVTVSGKPAYVSYISPTQVNILMPPDAMPGTVQVQLTNAGVTSNSVTVQAQAESPAFFTFNGGHYVVAEHANGSYIGPSSLLPGVTTPAAAGEVIVLFADGFGPTSTPMVTGSLTQTGTLSSTPVVSIGGVAAAVPYAGLILPGVFQFNVVVPPTTPPGDNILTATHNGFTTQAGLLLTVQQPLGFLQLQITGLPSGTSGNVSITAAGGFSAVVTSSQTLQVLPGIYTIVANSVPAGSVSYAAFPVQQSVAVAAGSTNPVTISYSIVVPNTTMVLDRQGSQGLTVSANGTTLTLPTSSQTAQSLSPGSVLAIGSTPATPNGLLRKVVSVSQSGSQVIAQTTQATLLDAFQQATFTSSIALTPQNTHTLKLSRSGVTLRWVSKQEITSRGTPPASCSGDSSLLAEMINTPILKDATGAITVTGEIDVCPSIRFDPDIRASPPKLNSLVATATLGEAVHVNITGVYHGSFNKQVPVATVTSDPLTVFVGPVPIVLTPSVTFFVGVSGEANAGFSIGATQTASVTGGFTYANGQLSNVTNSTSSFSQDPVGLDANLSAKAYAGLTIDLNIDGVLSPEFSPDAYLQLSVDLFKNPWWTLSAGLEGGASVKVGIFGVDLADFDAPDLFDFSKVIAQASGEFTGSGAVPVLNLVSPTSTLAGSQGLTLTLTGLNFVPGATVSFNGASIATAYGSPTQLTAFLPASALTTAGTFLVVVTNPDQTGARSEPFMFVVQPASPSSSVGWTQKFPATAPSPRYGHSMSYDAARNQVVLFGGLTNEGYNNDTWVWDGSTWTQKFPATAPSPRYGHSMSYDAARNQVLLFGGLTIEGYNNDTWVWDGSTWTQKFPVAQPSAREGTGIAYDGARNQVVLFGGRYFSFPGILNETWTWDGSNWTQRSPSNSPPPRANCSMIYDSIRTQVLLFGGLIDAGGSGTNDTWVWDGSTWTQKVPATNPPARYDHAMAYDGYSGQVVMFGGYTAVSGFWNVWNDTWTWDGSNWTQRSPSNGPSARCCHAMVYDAPNNQVLLFGGRDFWTVLSDTWVWKHFGPG